MGYEDISIFCTAFDERQTTEVFEHFFIVSLLYNLTTQFTDALDTNPLIALVSAYLLHPPRTLPELADNFIRDRYYLLEQMRAKPTVAISDLSELRTRRLNLGVLRELSERFALHARNSKRQLPSRLGLLLDSFDYYGQLGAILAPLLQSDDSSPLVVKLAARTLNVREVLGSFRSRVLEPDRDFHIVSLDREADDEEYTSLVRGAICRRVRRLGPPEAQNLDDGSIISILFSDSESDRDDIGSFDSFCRLASGNVLAVILLLDKAAGIQRSSASSKPESLAPLSREFRLRAIYDASQQFWDLEIGFRVPHHKTEAKVFCEAALGIARQEAPATNDSPEFELIVAPDKTLVSTMLATRVLTATDDTVNRRVQAGFDVPSPLVFEMNRLILPRFDRLPKKGRRIRLERTTFTAQFQKSLRSAKPHLNPRTPREQKELFRQDFRVFVSMPLDKAKRERTSILRKSINRLYREKTGREGGAGISFVDVHFLPQVGQFREEIPTYIRDSSYVVADITDIGAAPDVVPGVFYELGVAVGEKKPVVLFYNARGGNWSTSKFNIERLPAVIRGETVLIWNDSTENFLDEYRRIHEKLIGYNGIWEPLTGGVKVRGEIAHGRRIAYLSFQPRNHLAAKWFEDCVRRTFPELAIEVARTWQAEDLLTLRETIGAAELCIIDCTGKMSGQALELGIGASTGRRRVLEVWDSEQFASVNPVAMFPGRKWAWSDLSEEDERYFTRVLNEIGHSTTLGGRKS
jgi:hypothetical protein